MTKKPVLTVEGVRHQVARLYRLLGDEINRICRFEGDGLDDFHSIVEDLELGLLLLEAKRLGDELNGHDPAA
jgi:hypothetical protein